MCQEFCQVHPQDQAPSRPGTPPRDQVHPSRTRHLPDQVHPPGPGTPWDQVHPPDQVQPPETRYTPQDQVHPLGPVHPLSSACWEIRATSGQYASYWNAFLLPFRLDLKNVIWMNKLIQNDSATRFVPCSIITACKWSLGQGNVFTGMCQSVHGGGGLPPDRDPPWTETGPGQRSPWTETPPTPRRRPPCAAKSGRYASYWNAFLFL